MYCIVKPFGKGGLYITLKKSDGYKVGDKVLVGEANKVSEDQFNLICSEVDSAVKSGFEKFKKDIGSDFFDSDRLKQLFEIFKRWNIVFNFTKAKEDIDNARKKEGF